MAKEAYYGNGISREQYQQDKAILDRFEAIESDWKELFRWVMSVGSNIGSYTEQNRNEEGISDLWKNHVFTTLIDIIQTNVEGYKTSFIHGRGTTCQKDYTDDLESKIREWINRIEKYLQSMWQTGQNIEQNPAGQAAQTIKKRLEESLKPSSNIEKQTNRVMRTENMPYYKMLSSVDHIKVNAEYYIGMIEKGGDMDVGLSLLLTFIRNYSSIAEGFNRKFSALPEFYFNNILQVSGRKSIQDRTYVVVTPKPSFDGFTLPKGTKFRAGTKEDGQELIYKTDKQEYISPMKIAKVNSYYLQTENEQVVALYKQPIEITNPAICQDLFSRDSKYSFYNCGWQLESEILVLNEGLRKVRIHFTLTPESIVKLREKSFSLKDSDDAFSVWISSEQGWICKEHKMLFESGQLIFEFTIDKKQKALLPCSIDIHGAATTYPSVRILADNKNCPYDWATQISFESVGIDVDVEAIQNFELYNEQGQVDSTQPVYLFGTEGLKGAWFMFGNKEIIGKDLTTLSIKGLWNKLPQTANGYTDIYKDYPYTPAITNESFKVMTQWKNNGQWINCEDGPQPLFQITGNKPNERAEVTFNLSQCSDQNSGLFRVTLQEPAIGFGMEKYRELFAETMIYNSRQKENRQKKILSSPVIPLLSDIELSYKSRGRIDMISYNENSFIRLSRVTTLPEEGLSVIEGNKSQPLLPSLDSEHTLHIGLVNALGQSRIKIYFDLVFIMRDILLGETTSDNPPQLEFDYMKDRNWVSLSYESIKAENTCGFTQSGHIEISLPQKIEQDSHSLFWLRVRVIGDIRLCLAVRSIHLNCLSVVAENGEGVSILAGTITKFQQDNAHIESIVQPFSGFGGRPAETSAQSAIRQSSRISNRNRVVTPSDYEQFILEQFRDIKKVFCIPQSTNGTSQNVNIIAFSDSGDNAKYPTTPAWKLTEIKKFLSAYSSPFSRIRVINPCYEPVKVECTAILKPGVQDKGVVTERMSRRIREYYAWWQQKGLLPDLGRQYSYKEVHSILANDVDVDELQKLTVNDKWIDDVGVEIEDLCFSGNTPWSVIVLGKISITLLSEKKDIEKGKIGSSFIIG